MQPTALTRTKSSFLFSNAFLEIVTLLYFPLDILFIVCDIDFFVICEYRLVFSVEADPMNNRISNESPVGRALLGHKAGETVNVEVPAGIIKMEILEISK